VVEAGKPANGTVLPGKERTTAATVGGPNNRGNAPSVVRANVPRPNVTPPSPSSAMHGGGHSGGGATWSGPGATHSSGSASASHGSSGGASGGHH